MVGTWNHILLRSFLNYLKIKFLLLAYTVLHDPIPAISLTLCSLLLCYQDLDPAILFASNAFPRFWNGWLLITTQSCLTTPSSEKNVIWLLNLNNSVTLYPFIFIIENLLLFIFFLYIFCASKGIYKLHIKMDHISLSFARFSVFRKGLGRMNKWMTK